MVIVKSFVQVLLDAAHTRYVNVPPPLPVSVANPSLFSPGMMTLPLR